jgi:hypothetical protein
LLNSNIISFIVILINKLHFLYKKKILISSDPWVNAKKERAIIAEKLKFLKEEKNK